VSSSSTSLATTTGPEPYRNPTYPQRIHFGERGQLEEALRSCERRLDSARQKLKVLANRADQSRFVRLYHQMQGACDQVGEAVRRLPLEVGGLYHEDHERFEQAVEAMERTWRRWESASATV
jgi:hypothetical protein